MNNFILHNTEVSNCKYVNSSYLRDKSKILVPFILHDIISGLSSIYQSIIKGLLIEYYEKLVAGDVTIKKIYDKPSIDLVIDLKSQGLTYIIHHHNKSYPSTLEFINLNSSTISKSENVHKILLINEPDIHLFDESKSMMINFENLNKRYPEVHTFYIIKPECVENFKREIELSFKYRAEINEVELKQTLKNINSMKYKDKVKWVNTENKNMYNYLVVLKSNLLIGQYPSDLSCKSQIDKLFIHTNLVTNEYEMKELIGHENYFKFMINMSINLADFIIKNLHELVIYNKHRNTISFNMHLINMFGLLEMLIDKYKLKTRNIIDE